MIETMLLPIAIVVFVMMAIGLGLTIWEFRYGEPRRQKAAVEPESPKHRVKLSEHREVA